MKRKEVPQAIINTLTQSGETAMSAYEISSSISPEDPLKVGTLYRPLQKLAMAGIVEKVELPLEPDTLAGEMPRLGYRLNQETPE